MNGTCYALEEPSHLATDHLTVPDILKYDRVKTKPFNREWVVACWQPVLPQETAYSNSPVAAPYGYDQVKTPLVILIQTQSTTESEGLPFEWEWYLHYEAIGSGARGKTVSHTAPVKGPNVIAALQQAPSTLYDKVSNGRANVNTIANRMVDHGSSWQFAGDLMKKVATTAVGAVTSRAAAQYMGGGLAALAL